LQCPSARITGYDVTVPLSKGEKWFIVTPEKIIYKIREMMKYLS
jgi:pyruvate dehydrogenase E1 component beta subunit